MRLTFLGAAKMVTGSSYLVETDKEKFLIDCGMFQGSKAISAFNRRDFPYNPAEIDFVILTHAHIDHSGLLPKLCKAGFRGPIYATKVTAELCNIMLPDSAHIQEFDAEIANRKGKRAGRMQVEPLYTVAEAYDCLKQFAPVAYNDEVQLSPAVRVLFRDAGHILGSSTIEIWATEGDKTTKLVVSGDLGQPDQPIIKDPVHIEQADYVIVESTYGNRRHEHYDREERLGEIVKETIERGGNVVIPAFAVGRTQTILYHLHNLMRKGVIPDIPVFIDSPLAIAATNIFQRNPQEYDSEAYDMLFKDNDNPLKLPQLTFAVTPDESKAINNLTQPAVIISASGMADAGRILHHLKHNLWRPESTVLLVGYQAQGSLGRRLLEGAKRVKILGEEISVKAQIYNLDGFSAHADQEQLIDWLSHFKEPPVNVFIVHGEYEASSPFAQLIQGRLGFSTAIPGYGDAAVINGREWQFATAEIVAVDPTLLRLHDYLTQMEALYTSYRLRLEKAVAADAGKLPDIIRRLDKISAFVKKTLNDL